MQKDVAGPKSSIQSQARYKNRDTTTQPFPYPPSTSSKVTSHYRMLVVSLPSALNHQTLVICPLSVVFSICDDLCPEHMIGVWILETNKPQNLS